MQHPEDGVLSSSNWVLDCFAERCKQSLQRGMEGGLASLEAHRDAGAALVKLKELLPRGQFGLVAGARCDGCNQWRARLIKLHQEWNDILSALRWAESCGLSVSVAWSSSDSGRRWSMAGISRSSSFGADAGL